MSIRTAIYVRISLDKGGSALGVERQEKDCRKKAAALGWEVVGIYQDNDRSASKANVRRLGYERMLRDIELGLLDAVLIWDLDRLVRRPMELEQFMELVDRKGVKLANWTGDIDLSTSSGVLMARIKGALAAQEVRRLGERVQRQALQRAEMGLPPKRGRFGRLYGYTPEWEVVPTEAAIICEAYDRILNKGETAWSVMKHFNDSGYTTLTGKRWNRANLNNILDNPTYAGLRRWHGEILTGGTEAQWPAIVETETFYSWKAWREENGGDLDNHNKADRVRKYLLSGIARCGACTGALGGGRMGGKGQDGLRKTKYCCLASNGGCSKVLRSMEDVDRFVTEAFFLEMEKEKLSAAPSDDPQDEVDVAALEAEVEAYRVSHEAGDLPLGDYLRFTKPINERLQAARKAKVKAARQAARPSAEGIRKAFEVASLSTKRDMLRDRIDAVVILQSQRGYTAFDPELVKIVWREREQSASAA